MKRSVALGRYNQWVVNETIQWLYHNNIHYTGYGRDIPYWTAFHRRAVEIEHSLSEPKKYRRRARSTDVRAPEPIPNAPPAPATDAYERLQALGTVRCVRVAPLSTGGFSLLVRIDIPGRGRVYRYGNIRRRDDAASLIHKWIDKDYWTRDRS